MTADAPEKAREFMVREYGPAMDQQDQESRDLWHTRLGLLVCFAAFLAEGSK